MIRPVTCICFLMASASGLYLYQAKHASQVLDRTIEKTVHDTDGIREQTRALRTDWTLLNDPERLRKLAEQYLPTLKPVASSQFTGLADLDSRLPSPRVIPPEPSPVPIAEATPSGEAPTELTQDDTGGDALPVPPVPPPIIIAATPPAGQADPSPPKTEHKSAPHPVVPVAIVQPPTPKAPPTETRNAEARPAPTRLAEQKPPEPKPAESRPPIARVADLHPVPVQRPVTVAAQPAPTPAPVAPQFSGSLLGMAHGGGSMPPPLPRPVPVNAMSGQWPNGG